MVDEIDNQGDVSNPITWKEKGNEFFNQGEYRKAIECFAHAIELDPDYLPAWNNLGYTLLKMGKIKEAKSINQKIKEIKNKSIESIPPPESKAGSSFKEPLNTLFSPNAEEMQKKYENGEISYNQYQSSLKGEEIITNLSKEIESKHEKSNFEEKSPVIALLCSFFIPGLGQVYNGYTARGIGILIGTLIGLFLVIIPGIIVWFFGWADAYNTAKKMNLGEISFRPTKTAHILIFFILGIILIGITIIGIITAALFFSGVIGNYDSGDYNQQPTMIVTPNIIETANLEPINSPQNYHTYQNSKYDFSIDYLQNWYETEYPERKISLFGKEIILYPSKIVDFRIKESSSNLIFDITIDDPEGESLEDYYTSEVAALGPITSTKHNAQLKLSDQTIPAYRIDYYVGGGDDKIMKVFAINEEFAYITTYQGDTVSYNEHLIEAEEMINSIRFF